VCFSQAHSDHCLKQILLSIIITGSLKNDVHVTMHDSLNANISSHSSHFVPELSLINQDVLIIEVSKVNTQSGTFDCGLFTCAYIASLAHGQDLCTINRR